MIRGKQITIIKMPQDFGKKKRYFLVFIMIVTLVAIVVFILKKILAYREEYLKRLQLENEERHAETAILEEQEDQKIRDETNEKNMHVDLCQYNLYQQFNPERLWSTLVIPDIARLKTLGHATDHSAKVEIMLYYQSFVKLFTLKIISIKNLHCYKGNDSNLVKIKVLLCQPNGSIRNTEVSKTYEINDEISIDERFTFKMLEHQCRESFLYLCLWNIDAFYQETLLGAISIDMSLYNHAIKTTIIEDFLPVRKVLISFSKIKTYIDFVCLERLMSAFADSTGSFFLIGCPYSPDTNVYGYLLVSLCHLPLVERLICVVMSGKELQEDKKNTSILNNRINPYVKISLLNDGKLIRKYKSNIIQDTCNPFFNEMIEFYIPTDQLQTADILLMVMHKDSNKLSKVIGKLLLGSHSCGTFHQHWSEAIENTEQSVAKWHPLTR
ncbi:synaptotagmin-2-like [Hydractinia symbiolongicarpus]|uniref:synaptotagmin-2-like n=1 Tax=Hydractinia symbiolongicarpus TaxID=13093 RepID=UPI0025508FE2|nr:synaptotagmin-2-like [Hydractinia symbiolongicarpus]